MTEMQDWPLRLKLSAARDALAQSIYYATTEVDGGHTHWDALTPERRQAFRETALKAIEAHRGGQEVGRPANGLTEAVKAQKPVTCKPHLVVQLKPAKNLAEWYAEHPEITE